MEKIQERINTAQRALTKLHELAVKPDLSDVERDALIQRFEFSFELLLRFHLKLKVNYYRLIR